MHRPVALALLLSFTACSGEDPESAPPVEESEVGTLDAASDASDAKRDEDGDAPSQPSDTGVVDSTPLDAEAPTSDAPAADTKPTTDSGPVMASRGATLPYDEYEAEGGATNGTTIGPTRVFGELATEASGRRAVRLSTTGQYVRFTTKRASNSIVLRYAIPDAPNGGGLDATLSVYVDGVHRKDLALTSRYAWIYGGEAGSSNNSPSAGGAHAFYDEARALIGDVPAGAIVELRKDASDTAAWYVVDLIDLEQVAPPLARPANAISVTEHGAVADDGKDDGQAFRDAIAAARASGKGVWIPPGTFHSTLSAIDVAAVTIRGAGMWHSAVRGFWARFRCTGNDCRYHDFSVLGETVARDDASAESAFLGGGGTGSRLENVWIEHTKTGWWVGPTKTDGLVIKGCRFRNLFADAVNLCNGASNSVVEQSHARNTGDDAFVTWSPSFDGPSGSNNVFRFDTVQVPWRANCFAIYGGKDHRIEDSVCSDVVTYPGVLLAQQFDAHPFSGTTRVDRVSLIRAGGSMWGQQHGALKLHAFDASMKGFALSQIDIIDATYAGIHFQGPHAIEGVVMSDVKVSGVGTFGIDVDADAQGSATMNAVVVTGGLKNDAGAKWTFTRGAGSSGF